MASKVSPISPKEAQKKKAESIPDAVFDAFNELIVLNLTASGEALVMQERVVDLIVEKLGCKRQEIFDNHWLCVEEKYRAAGWKVEYDKPGPSESYPASFTFSAPKK